MSKACIVALNRTAPDPEAGHLRIVYVPDHYDNDDELRAATDFETAAARETDPGTPSIAVLPQSVTVTRL